MNKKIVFLILLVFLVNSILNKLNRWYIGFQKNVRSFHQGETILAQVSEDENRISNVTYTEILDSQSIFAETIGYVVEFHLAVENDNYWIFIFQEEAKNHIHGVQTEYRQVSIYSFDSPIDQGTTYSTYREAHIDGYVYTVDCGLYKEDYSNSESALSKTRALSQEIIETIIDEVLSGQ